MEQRTLSRYQLPKAGVLRLGRAENSDIVVRDPVASRLHALLHVGDAIELEDAGSHNGTTARGQRLSVGSRVRLNLGDTVQIGSATLLIQRAPRATRVASTDSEDWESDDSSVVICDPAMRQVYDLAARVAPSTISVLVTGETGAGKERVAETIHRLSGTRSRGPYVRINCAALTETLFESELFGHQRGSFTGATQSKSGLLQSADKGTVLLDEIGELPLSVQPKLLRAIESREIVRVGALRPEPIDVRFIAATNRDLRLEIERGSFREDLFFRLNGVTLRVPPLRERLSEIEPLVDLFLTTIASELGRPKPTISRTAMLSLRQRRWPGNIRELKNAVECAVMLAGNGPIEPVHFPEEAPRAAAAAATSGVVRRTADAATQPERERILAALAACNGNQTRAAEYLGMPRRTLVAKLVAYDIPRPRKLSPRSVP
jgi:DNA-binding NtrC family response regulator